MDMSTSAQASTSIEQIELPPPVAAYVEAFNAGNFELLLEQFTPDARIHGVLGSLPVQQAEPVWRELLQAMAIELIPQAAAVDGSSVALRYVERGRFQGRFRGLAGHEPTNRTYEVTAMEWFELEGGLIHERWGARDSASITRQVLGS